MMKSMAAGGKEIWVTEDVDKAELFAQYYTKIFTVESDDGPMTEVQGEAVCEEIVVSLDMVMKKLKKINPNKSRGQELLHPRVIYEVKKVIAYHLTLLFNKSLSSGQLPEDWKYDTIVGI